MRGKERPSELHMNMNGKIEMDSTRIHLLPLFEAKEKRED